MLAEYLQSDCVQGQILMFLINQLGDHPMELYFKNVAGAKGGGYGCDDEIMGTHMDEIFQQIDARYRESFRANGGEYIEQEHEKKRTCAIRLPNTVFFEVCARNATHMLHAIIATAWSPICACSATCRTNPRSSTGSTIRQLPRTCTFRDT